jgi:hypothetical protein
MSLFVKNTTIINSRLIVGSTSFVVPTPTPTPSTTPSIVSSGLVIQLDAHESLSYPGTGTTVFDITGGFNHTLIGATYTVRNGIKCFDCTTGNNRVTVNGTGPLLPNSGYTYITWARLITSTAGFRTLLYTNSPKYTPITIPNGTNTLGYWDTSFKSSGYDVASSVGVWVQFAVVGTNTSQTFYINGSQVGSTISAGAGGTTHWGWGNNDIAGQPWGHVANMYFYNRQLNLAEITQQYNYLAPRFMEITPTPTNTQTPTTTSTPTPTPTNTSTPTVTPTNTTSPTTLTQTPTITPTPTPSITPTLTQTPTITPSAGTGVTFSRTFTGSTAPSTTIENAWTSFRSQLTGTYTTMTMSNSLGTSLTVNDANVQSIANALRTGTTGTNFSVIIGSRTWRVIHGCVAGTVDVNSIFLTSSGECDCGSAGTYTIRPMIKNLNWGGLNGSSCGQPTQTITLTFS